MVTNISLIVITLLTYWLSAKRYKLLTGAGAMTAILGGVIIYLAFSWKGLVLIGLFFISSSFWSRFTAHARVKKVKDVRNSFQVLANGGGAFIASFGYYLNQDEAWVAFFIASLAAANADTWASEIGVLSKRQPIHIIKWQRLESGMSGAVTLLGTLAASCGAFIIALLGIILFQYTFTNVVLSVFLLTSIGFLGCFLDTIIGAVFEVTYKCPSCGQIVEQKTHCGYKTILQSGIRFIGNNQVNFITTFFSGVIGGFVFWL